MVREARVQLQHGILVLPSAFGGDLGTKDAHDAQEKRVALPADLQDQPFDGAPDGLPPRRNAICGKVFLEKRLVDGLDAGQTDIDLARGQHLRVKRRDIADRYMREIEGIRVNSADIEGTVFQPLPDFAFAQRVDAHADLSAEALPRVEKRDKQPGRSQREVGPRDRARDGVETEAIGNRAAEEDRVQIVLVVAHEPGGFLRQDVFEGDERRVVDVPNDGEDFPQQVRWSENSDFHNRPPRMRLICV
ncbi:hypothetical protein SDC9_168664 [bioreactor metagenome]|uniref:Uncharacterized protein n=1 Tax=bioreactor metagenome TaxID=1076179 RepID=A0A645G3R6_9ZZZZ